MRSAFIDELVRLAKTNPQIALIVGDLGYSVVEEFAESYPERFVNAGVAEQNMTGLAAGMASEGYHVFNYSIANFPTFRCAEQLRNDVDYHGLAVTVVAVGGGVAYGTLGYSHHAVQDYALIRTMPNMLIAAPGDPLEARACLRYLVKKPGPSYLRLGKAGEPSFHQSVPDVAPGCWLKVAQGSAENEVLLTTGAGLGIAMSRHADQPQSPPTIYSLPLWGMAHKYSQLDKVLQHAKVTTFEDHLHDAGFGSWLLESVRCSPEALTRIRCEALDSAVCGMVGSQHKLNLLCGV